MARLLKFDGLTHILLRAIPSFRYGMNQLRKNIAWVFACIGFEVTDTWFKIIVWLITCEVISLVICDMGIVHKYVNMLLCISVLLIHYLFDVKFL